MIRIRKEDLFFAPMTFLMCTATGGGLGTLSAIGLVWFLGGELYQYTLAGAGIGLVLAVLLCIWIVRGRIEEDGDIMLDLRFTLKLIIALGATGSASAAFDTLISGPRIPGGIIPYVSYAALFGAGLGLIMGIYWNLREKKLPLRDELMLAHEDELDRMDRSVCQD